MSAGSKRSLDESCTILVTGGAGFIGSNFIRHILSVERCSIIALDKLTYAGNVRNLDGLPRNRLTFIQGDICDRQLVSGILSRDHPSAFINFAAQSHVDRSIHDARDFIQTNVLGTFNLLECARTYYETTSTSGRDRFCFLNISTDEVYGSIGLHDPHARESSPYRPNNPYAASKAGGDHLARAWSRTYGLPLITTNCSNNYGPYQFPEKLIPLMIYSAIDGRSLPVYGDGLHIRDWLFVEDHCEALRLVLKEGQLGESYNIAAGTEKTNTEVVQTICDILDIKLPKTSGASYREQITFVRDRPGHDRRYALDASKIAEGAGWRARVPFESGISRTIDWYLANRNWFAPET
jgi:dTDP-glucose 4,6-dehydratase